MRLLSNKHIGKQRVEAMQILRNVIFWQRFQQDVQLPVCDTVQELLNNLLHKFQEVDYTYMFEFDGSNPVQRPQDYVLTPEEKQRGCFSIKKKVGFGTHSATRMWLNYPDALKAYTNAAIAAHIERGYVNNMLTYPLPEQYPIPNWITSTRFIGTMQINLLKKDASHYVPVFMRVHSLQQVQEFNENTAIEVAQYVANLYQLPEKLSAEKMQNLFDWVSRTKDDRPITDYFWPID